MRTKRQNTSRVAPVSVKLQEHHARVTSTGEWKIERVLIRESPLDRDLKSLRPTVNGFLDRTRGFRMRETVQFCLEHSVLPCHTNARGDSAYALKQRSITNQKTSTTEEPQRDRIQLALIES